jgi:hypothetical protein
VIEFLSHLPDTEKVAIIALGGVTFSAIIAFVGIIVSAVIAYTSSRRSNYINSVTIERSKWISALRINISELSKEAMTLNYKVMYKEQFFSSLEYYEYNERMNGLKSLIRLQLNPFGEIDQNILTILMYIDALSIDISDKNISQFNNLLIVHAQWLLKAEWERVKYEAAGFFGKRKIDRKLKEHSASYRSFCQAEGRIPSVLGR